MDGKLRRILGLALTVGLLSASVSANTIGYSPGALPITLAMYELAVVVAEWFMIRALLCQTWGRALGASALANSVSFAAGACASFAISSMFIYNVDYWHRKADYATRIGELRPAWFIFNFAVEAIVVLLVCRLRFSVRIVLCIAGIHLVTWPVGAVLFAPPLESGVRSAESRARSDIRSMATALEAYFIDNSTYPIPVPVGSYVAPNLRKHLAKAGASRMTIPAGLTTPVAYLTVLFRDPYAVKGAPYAYHGDSNGWIVVSPGPDHVYDIDPANDYVSTQPQTAERILLKSYDPSNGATSTGDIVGVHSSVSPMGIETPRSRPE